jgi:hypothetical protein
VTEDITADAMLESPESDEPGVLYTAYLSSVEEIVEHVKAADTLGLGFRLESYMISVEDSDAAYGEFEFTLLTHMPTRAGEEAGDED